MQSICICGLFPTFACKKGSRVSGVLMWAFWYVRVNIGLSYLALFSRPLASLRLSPISFTRLSGPLIGLKQSCRNPSPPARGCMALHWHHMGLTPPEHFPHMGQHPPIHVIQVLPRIMIVILLLYSSPLFSLPSYT